jgi:hypothetical protein
MCERIFRSTAIKKNIIRLTGNPSTYYSPVHMPKNTYTYAKVNFHLLWLGANLHPVHNLHICIFTFTYMQLRSHGQIYSRVQILHTCRFCTPWVNQCMCIVISVTQWWMCATYFRKDLNHDINISRFLKLCAHSITIHFPFQLQSNVNQKETKSIIK